MSEHGELSLLGALLSSLGLVKLCGLLEDALAVPKSQDDGNGTGDGEAGDAQEAGGADDDPVSGFAPSQIEEI